MSGGLRVDSVRAQNFGGLTNVELELPSAPMVVIHGANETGKSTLSELITWLLVGPATDGSVIRQYGEPDEALVGSLAGSLRGEKFSVAASFKVTPGGGSIATASTREYTFGSLLTAEQWRQHIGGVDRQTFAGIYRLWGQQLHDGVDADAELRRAGLGALAGAADPRELAKKFEIEARQGAKIGPSSSSFRSVMTELDEVMAAMREAERNVDDYRRLKSEFTQLEAQRREISQRRSRLQERQSLLERAGQLDAVRRDEVKARDTLQECEATPKQWARILDDPAAVSSAIKGCRDARAALQGSETKFTEKVADAGVAGAPGVDEVVKRITITAHDTATIATAVAEVSHAAGAVVTADKTRREVADLRLAAAVDLDSALDSISADEESLRAAKVDVDAQLQLRKLSDDFRAALTRVEQTQVDLDAARAASVEAESSLQFAIDGWNRFGVGVGPAEWLGGGAAVGTGRADTPAIWWMLVGVVIAFGVVSVVLGQWVLVVLALVALVISLRTKPGPVVVSRSDDLVAAATRVTEAEQRLDAAKTVLTGGGEQIAAVQRRVVEITSEVPRVSRRFGLSISDDPLELRGSLESWVEARKVLDRLDSLTVDVDKADAKLVEAQAIESVKLDALDRLLARLGLPVDLSPEAVESAAAAHVDLVAAARNAAQCRVALERANDHLFEIMAPVANEIASWSLDRLESRVVRAVDSLNTYGKAEAGLAGASKIVETIVGDDLEFRKLLEEGLAPEEREVEIERIAAEITIAGTEVEKVSERLGLLADGLSEVSRAERLADLRLRQGSLIEARDDLAIEAASRRLAGLMLRAVADDYEQKNQPDLIKRTGELASQVADRWKAVVLKPTGSQEEMLHVRMASGTANGVLDVAVRSLSTGARALLYLALRLSMAEQDGLKRGLDLPLICDDPLIHLDDERADSAVRLLGEAANRRQVLLFTCHQRTVDVATNAGAELVRLGSVRPSRARRR